MGFEQSGLSVLLLAIGTCGLACPAMFEAQITDQTLNLQRPSIGSPTRTPSPQTVSTCPKAPMYLDGCAGVSDGRTVFPNLLARYKARPPWNVAGVDFSVGIPTDVLLRDPRRAKLPSGCLLSGNTVVCSGTVTLDAYDFSLNNGTSLLVTGGNVTVQNSLFVVGPNQGALGKIVDVIGATNASFLHNEFDGANIGVTPQRGQTIGISNVGLITFKYNFFHNSGGDMIDFTGGPQVNIVQYNMLKDIGLKTAHSDTLQWCGSIVSDSDLSFNTIVQTKAGLSGMGLLTVNSECPGAKMSNILVHNNTLISRVRDNFATGANVTQNAGPATADHVAIFDNYVDPNGVMNFTASPWFPTGYYANTLPRPSTFHSLIDMRSGSSISLPSRSKTSGASDRSYYVYPDASGYRPGLSDIYSITASPSSGGLSAGGTITFALEMNENWEVSGTPSLSLSSGGTAEFSGGSGTPMLTFSHTVKTGESANKVSITAVNLGGGLIKDAFGNSANMAGAITDFPDLTIQSRTTP